MAESSKAYTVADLKKHTSTSSCWLAVRGKVYDVTEFLEEHPGGYDIILSSTGKDATQDFDEIGHSNSAKQMLEKYLIGTLEGGDIAPSKAPAAAAAAPIKPVSSTVRAVNVVLPVVLLAVAVALNYYWSKAPQAA